MLKKDSYFEKLYAKCHALNLQKSKAREFLCKVILGTCYLELASLALHLVLNVGLKIEWSLLPPELYKNSDNYVVMLSFLILVPAFFIACQNWFKEDKIKKVEKAIGCIVYEDLKKDKNLVKELSDLIVTQKGENHFMLTVDKLMEDNSDVLPRVMGLLYEYEKNQEKSEDDLKRKSYLAQCAIIPVSAVHTDLKTHEIIQLL